MIKARVWLHSTNGRSHVTGLGINDFSVNGEKPLICKEISFPRAEYHLTFKDEKNMKKEVDIEIEIDYDAK